ncbi:MAG: Omp28-related outer membrane protein [Bacteroidetes bacterium]|nr:Omp28-related outer membrane protein [Bacteroidota bacterium]
MKKQLLTIVAAGAVSSMFAQLPVSTAPQNRKAVLEEFTGINCQYCPDGHKIAAQIQASKPAGDVILVNIHTGGYATPSGTQPDYRVADGNAIAGMPGMGITGYPTGAINRNIFSGTAMAHSRSAWATNVNTILSQTSCVNVALQGTLNAVTRVLQVQAQVYYTANSTAPTNSLTIALLEDWVVGPQTSGAIYYPAMTNPDGSYNHQHMLRDVITTGSFGIPVAPTTVGSTYTSPIISYTVPSIFGAGTNTNVCNLGNLQLIAFVADGQTQIRTAAFGPITMTGIPNALDLGVAANNLVTDAQVCDAKLNGSFKFTNSGSVTATSAVFAYSINGSAPTNFTWTGSVNALATSPSIQLPTINFAPVTTNSLTISVVSVNGSADQNTANDIASKNNIPLTTVTANMLNMQMDFTQDRYGDEISWGVYDEQTMTAVPGATIALGTYPLLGANGTQLHTHTFVINQAKCYKLIVKDSYGDGINAGAGAGNYILKSGGTNIITSNGMYGSGENKWYKSSVTAGIGTEGINISNVNVYPNPASNAANINIEMAQNENVNIVIVNALGQVVYNETKSFDAGSHNINLNTENWASGLYNINMTTSKGSATQKLTISK